MLTAAEILELMPQKPPFRFLDELVRLDNEGAVGRYTFRHDESFYAGHFPGNPVTPGVILAEALCQTGLVAYGIYLMAQDVPAEEVGKMVTLLTNLEVDFMGMVLPGETVTIEAEKIYWRMRKLRSRVTMRRGDGELACSGTVAGMAVPRASL